MLGQPSVIARLMGLEAHATIVVPATAAVTIRAEDEAMVNLPKPPSKLKQFKCSPLPHRGRINVEYYRYCLSKMKPRRRSSRRSSSSSSSSSSRGHRRDHHPQEELLEKIKEEFLASWQQASMTPEDAAVTSSSASGRMSSADRAGWVDGRYIQRVAQENLRREKIARHGHGGHGKTKVEELEEDEEEDVETVVVGKKAEAAEQQQGGSEGSSEERSMEEGDTSSSSYSHPAESEKFLGSSGAVVGGFHDRDRMSSTSENLGGAATRIAILRPIGTTRAAGDHREPAAFGTPPPSWKATRDGGMEEFLRVVKERLDNEMKAKTGASDEAPPPPTTTATARRLWGSADQEQQTARDTARQIREAMVTKEDLGRRLSRLESFRVFRGDRGRRDAASLSPEHRMLKRVRARIEAMSPKKTRLSGSSSPLSTRAGRIWSSPPPGDASLSGIGSDDDDESCCCRGDRQRLMTKLWKEQGAAHTAGAEAADVVSSPSPSPRALLRSFSAPASSRVSDGGPETCGDGAEVKFSRSRSFSLVRGTASGGLRQSFSLLLMHLTKKSPPSPQDSGDLTITAPQADFLAGLPPPSPVSPLEVHGRSPRHFFPESSPRRSPKCWSELEASVVGGESPWRWRTDDAAERKEEDPDKAYVRELLIAAGLFDDDEDGGSWEGTAVGSRESMAGPAIMSDDVFDEVEDAYYYRRRVDEDCAGEEEEEDGWTDRRRLLFDLANEALQSLQGGPSSSSYSLPRWVVDNGVSSSQRLRLRGRDLEDEVWRHVARAMTGDDDAPVPVPVPATTVDGMVEREVGRSPWMALREDVCSVGRKVERAILDDLVGEVVRQVFVRT